jgi:hypothetical protein
MFSSCPTQASDLCGVEISPRFPVFIASHFNGFSVLEFSGAEKGLGVETDFGAGLFPFPLDV